MSVWNAKTQYFNAQGSRVIIVVVQVVGAVKIYVAAVEALRKKEKTGDHQNWRKKLVWVAVISSFSKIFIPIMQKLAILAP